MTVGPDQNQCFPNATWLVRVAVRRSAKVALKKTLIPWSGRSDAAFVTFCWKFT